MNHNSQQNRIDSSSEKTSKPSPSKSLLFVCLGNICRSPAAEGVMRALAVRHGVDQSLEIESAGTGGYHDGKFPDPRMRSAAEKRGYLLDSRAKTITKKDFARFDLIVAMDRDNLRAIHAVGDAKPNQLKLLSDYLGDDWPTDVPDPYYGGTDGFEYVLDMLETACPAILSQLFETKHAN